MATKFTEAQIEDLQNKLGLIYGRPFGQEEAREFAVRLFSMYEELRG